MGPEAGAGMSVEFVDVDRQLPVAHRNTIANMMAEAEAMNGIFAADEITIRMRQKGSRHSHIRESHLAQKRARHRRGAVAQRRPPDDCEALQSGQRISR